MILAHNVPILPLSTWMWYRPFCLDFPHAYTVSLLAYLFNWHLCLPVKTTHVHSFHSWKHFPNCPTTSGWIGFALSTSFRLLDEAWVWIWMLYYLYTAISSAILSLCKLYSLYAESPMRAPGHNALLIRFFDFGIIYIVCFLPSVLWRCWLGGRKGIRPVKNWVVGCWRGYLSGARCRLAEMAQLMPLPLTVSCFSKIQIGFTFLVLAHPDSPGKRAVKRVCIYCLLVFIICFSTYPFFFTFSLLISFFFWE